MTPIEKQILRNQRDIMIWLSSKNQSYSLGYFGDRIEETENLINPKQSDDSCGMEETRE